MPANSKKTETLVGVFMLIGLSLLGAIILLFGKIGSFFRESYEIKVNFTEAAGVIKGSTVRFRGAKIGEVAAKPLLIGEEQIQVVLAINEDHRIEKGSIFRIETASLLGDKAVVVIPPKVPTQAYIEAGALLQGGGPGGLDRLQNEAEGIATETREVMKEAKDALIKIKGSIDQISEVAAQLTTTLEKVNTQVLSGENLERVSGTLGNLEEATASFVKLGADLGPVVGDFRETIGEIRGTNEAVQSAVKRIDPALAKVPDVMAAVERTVEAARRALEKVQEKKGALGALVSDEELKGDMKDFVRNLKEKGILRYKDEEADEEDPRDRFRGRRR